MNRDAASLVAALADLLARVFIAERWQSHKPLKIGIDADLIATGILTPSEAKSALCFYTSRRMYLVATAASGFRFDLNGRPAGEVTPQAADWARRRLVHMDERPAREAKKAAEGGAWVVARRAARAVADRSDAAPAPQPQLRPSSDMPRRLSLADLRTAAKARRQAALADHLQMTAQ